MAIPPIPEWETHIFHVSYNDCNFTSRYLESIFWIGQCESEVGFMVEGNILCFFMVSLQACWQNANNCVVEYNFAPH